MICITGTVPAKEVVLSVNTDSVSEAVSKFMSKYPAARLETIDGKLVRGFCRLCNQPVLERESGYNYDPVRHHYTCHACMVSRRNSNRKTTR